MSPSASSTNHKTLTPDEAFSILGNETRIQILQELGEADQSLSFTDLRERVGVRQGAQFNYHLDKVVGHFVAKTDAGYSLRPAGNRVVEAILSGAVTADPVFGPERLDEPCPYCGAPIEVEFHQGRLHYYCTECHGTYGHTALSGVSVDPAERGYLGMSLFPPAGVSERDPGAVVEAATVWGHLDRLRPANGFCPRCATGLETSADVCSAHDADNGLCEKCGFRHGIRIQYDCTNCTFSAGGSFADWLLADDDLVAFLTDHGVNPISPRHEDMRIWMDYDEDVRSVDPFEARFTFTLNDETLTLTVDDDLQVTDAARERIE